MVFIPFLVILLVESNFNNVVWNIGLIPFAIVILAGLVLTFFVSESPSAVYLNDEKLINYIDTLLEEIDEKKHEIEDTLINSDSNYIIKEKYTINQIQEDLKINIEIERDDI
jgi:hypothetical protein